jgi:pilus assembly protein CpaB
MTTMTSGATRRRSSLAVVLFMGVAVVFAALGGVLIARLLGQRYASEPVQPVVVAARAIRSGTPLRPTDLRVAQWPVSSIPRGAFDTLARLLGSEAVPLTPLVAGEPVLASHLSAPRSGMGVAAKLGASQRAMAIRADASVTHARLVYPGARVDVLATLRRPGPGFRGVKTKVILQNLLVLAVGPDLDPLSAMAPAAKASSGEGVAEAITATRGSARPQAVRRVVTLAVTSEQAERLVLASREGKLDLILRSPRDGATVETPGSTAASTLGETEEPSDERGPTAAVVTARPAPTIEKKKKRRRRRRARRRRAARPQPVAARPTGPEIYRVR